MVEHPESIAPASPWHREGWGTQLGLSRCARGMGAMAQAASSPPSPPSRPAGPGVSWGSQCVPGQSSCGAVAAVSTACPEDGVTTEHGLHLGWRGVPCPREPPLARSGHLPWCWANACPCLLPPRRWGCRALACSSSVVPLPPALVQGLLLSASLCVLPVVLPYGRLRHAVLPQGRTTDGMPGLPLRPRTPVSLRGQGSEARAMSRAALSSGWWGSGGSPCGEARGVCAQQHACVCMGTAAGVGLSHAVPAGITGAPSGASGNPGCSLLVSAEALHKPRAAPLGQRVPSPSHARAQRSHRHPEETGTWFVRGVLWGREAVPSAGAPRPRAAPGHPGSWRRSSPRSPFLSPQGVVLPPVPRGAQPHVLPLRVRWQEQLLPADQPCLLHQP